MFTGSDVSVGLRVSMVEELNVKLFFSVGRTGCGRTERRERRLQTRR